MSDGPAVHHTHGKCHVLREDKDDDRSRYEGKGQHDPKRALLLLARAILVLSLASGDVEH